MEGQEAAPGGDVVHLVACGTVLPEVLEAAARLADEGVAANVVDVTSVDRLFRQWRAAALGALETAGRVAPPPQLERLFPASEARAPIVTVHDGAPHTMSWLGAVRGVPVVPLGVDRFGQVGSTPDLYRSYRLDAPSVVNAALLALAGGTSPA